MTWQRIDEDTYIDDTLVTCAEYQLFIDEMDNQGLRFQPDHWTSNRFSIGQARKPILGVRALDAQVFCEWLTTHASDKKWIFRLPHTDEVGKWAEKRSDLAYYGYWGKEAKNFKFIWNGSPAINPRFLQIENLPNAQIPELITSYFRVVNLPLDFLLCITKFGGVRRKDLLDFMVYLPIERFPDNLMKKAIRSHYFKEPGEAKINIERSMSYFLNQGMEVKKFPEIYFDLYVDLYTLQERIAGRSPAFEGIRLVKERTR